MGVAKEDAEEYLPHDYCHGSLTCMQCSINIYHMNE